MRKRMLAAILTVCLAMSSAAVPSVEVSAAGSLKGLDVAENALGAPAEIAAEDEMAGRTAVIQWQTLPDSQWEWMEYEKQLCIYGCLGTAENLALPSMIYDTSTPGSYAYRHLVLLESYVFENCAGLKNVLIPANGMEIEIGGDAFNGCGTLEGIYVEESEYYTPFASEDGILYNKDKTRLIRYPQGKRGSIDIPDSVTEIGEYAFYGCSNITRIQIPNSVRKIRRNAFYGCGGLQEITYEGNALEWLEVQVDNFGNEALDDIQCAQADQEIANIKWKTLPDSQWEWMEYEKQLCIYGCLGTAENLALPSMIYDTSTPGSYAYRHLVLLESYVFENCAGLKNVLIPANGMEIEIGGDAFNGCGTLEGIYVEESEYYTPFATEDGILYNKDKTKLIRCPEGKQGRIEIPDTVETIDKGAFLNCTGITGIQIPASVNEVKERAFSGCSGLQEVSYLGNTVQWVKIKIASENRELRHEIVQCLPTDRNITNIRWKNTEASEWEWELDGARVEIKEYRGTAENIAIPSGFSTGTGTWRYLTNVGSDVFAGRNCAGLKNILLLDNGMKVEIEGEAFDGCASLEGIYVFEESGNLLPYSSTEDGILYNKDKTELIRCPEGWEGEVDVLPGVSSIAEGAFKNCTKVSGVNLPDSIEKIADGAFSGCSSIRSMGLEEGLESIGNRAFSGCLKLESLQIPSSVREIGEEAFFGCSRLGDVEIPDGVREIGNEAFSGCSSIRSVGLEEGLEMIGNGAFSGCVSLEKIQIPSSIVSVGGNAFSGCISLKSAEIRESKDLDKQMSIGDNAFLGCTALETVKLAYNVSRVGSKAFKNCSSLKRVELPRKLKDMEEELFSGCRSLNDITIVRRMRKIGKDAFKDCAALKNVYYAADAEKWKTLQIEDGNAYLLGADFHYDMQNSTNTEMHTVSFDSRGVSEDPDQLIPENELVDVKPQAPARPYHTFLGWYHGDKRWDFENDEVRGDMCLVAKWEFVTLEEKEQIHWFGGSQYDEDGNKILLVGKTIIQGFDHPDGYIIDSVLWTSSNPNVLENVSGVNNLQTYSLTARESGTCKVTADVIAHETSPLGDISIHKYKREYKFRVVTPIQSVELQYDKLELPLNGAVAIGREIGCTIGPESGNYAKEMSGFYFKSSNPNVVSVSPQGILSAEGYGSARISVGISSGEMTYLTVTVPKPEEGDNPTCRHTDTQLKNNREATCTEKGYTGDWVCRTCGEVVKRGKEITAKGHEYEAEIEKATLSEEGSIINRCSMCGKTKGGKTVIHSPKTIHLSKTSYTYDGKAKNPSITIKDSQGRKLEQGLHYTVSYGKGRKNVGRYTVTVKFLGNYSGTVKKTFTIIPQKVKGLKLVAKPMAWKASWKRGAAPDTGYELQYSNDKKFNGNTTKIIPIGKNKTTAKTVSGLKGGEKYYVRIRAYKKLKADGKTIKLSSGWSGVKSVTTKKKAKG